MGRVKIRSYVIVATAALAAALAAPSVASASTTITIQDTNSYNPASATLDLGDGSFDWEWAPGGAGTVQPHNVVQDDGLFSSGEPVSADPDGYSVTASAGGYPYFCQVHFGMEGDVKVRPVLGPSDTGRGPIPVMWAAADHDDGRQLRRPLPHRREVEEVEERHLEAHGHVWQEEEAGQGEERALVPVPGALALRQEDPQRVVPGARRRPLSRTSAPCGTCAPSPAAAGPRPLEARAAGCRSARRRAVRRRARRFRACGRRAATRSPGSGRAPRRPA